MSRGAALPSAAERRIEWGTIGLGIVAAAVVLARGTRPAALGIMAGTALAWLNFRWLRGVVVTLEVLSKQQAGAEKPRVPRGIYARFFAGFALLLAVVCASFLYSSLPGAAVVAGLFTLVAAVLIECVYQLARGPRPGAD
jgi:hypothetical protein